MLLLPLLLAQVLLQSAEPCSPPAVFDYTASEGVLQVFVDVRRTAVACVSVGEGDRLALLPPDVGIGTLARLSPEDSDAQASAAPHRLFSVQPLVPQGAAYSTATLPLPAASGEGEESGELQVAYWSAAEAAWHRVQHSSVAVRSRSAEVLMHVYESNPFVTGNHNPSFKLTGIDVTVAEDSGIYTQGDQFVTGIDDGNQFTQSVRFRVTNSFTRLFETQPHIIGCNSQKCQGTLGVPITAGSLHFSVAPNVFGRALVTVVAVDDGIEFPVCDGPPIDVMTMMKCDPHGPTSDCIPALCTNSDPQTFWIEVLPVNDPPSFDHRGDVTSPEDQPTCHDDWASAITAGGWEEDFMQADAQPLSFTLTTQQPELFTTQPYLLYRQGASTASLCYEPAPNKVGQASVSVTLTDGGNPPLSFPTQYVAITITEVNDPPSFVAAQTSVEVLEDSGPYSAVFARDIVPGPDEEVKMGQRLAKFTIHFEDQALAGLFKTLPRIDVNTGVLEFEPLPDANTFGGAVNLRIQLEDRVDAPGSPAGSPVVPLAITITPVNDPPSFTPPDGDPTVVVYEDQAVTRPIPWASRICIGGSLPDHCVHSEGDANGEGQRIAFTLRHVSGDVGIFKPDHLPQMDPSGHIAFELANNKAGDVVYSVSQVDTGPFPNAGPDHELTIRVTPVNDAPSFELSTLGVVVKEDSGQPHPVTGEPNFHFVEGFLHSVLRGPLEPDEGAQELRCAVEGLTDTSLFHPLGGMPAVQLTLGGTRGTLVFRTFPDRVGVSEGAVVCRDSGGTAHGGEDTARSTTFSITVTDVGDIPSFALPPILIVVEDNGPRGSPEFTIAGVVSRPTSASPLDEVKYDIAPRDPTPFAELPRISDAGALLFTLLPDFNGNATLRVSAYLAPRGNSTLRGVSSNVSSTTLVVAPYNDPPTLRPNPEVLRQAQGGQLEAVEVPICVGVWRDPDTCEHRVATAFTEVSAGPPDEVLAGQRLLQDAPLLGVGIAIPAGVSQYVSHAALSQALGSPSARDITFVLRKQALQPTPLSVPLPAFTANITIADDGAAPSGLSLSATSLLLPIQLVLPAPAPGAGPPAQLLLARAPSVEPADPSVVRVAFSLADTSGTAVPSASARSVNITLVALQQQQGGGVGVGSSGLRYPMQVLGAPPSLVAGEPLWTLSLIEAVSGAVPPGDYVVEASVALLSRELLTARTPAAAPASVVAVPVEYTVVSPSGRSPVAPGMPPLREVELKRFAVRVALEVRLGGGNTTAVRWDVGAVRAGVACVLEEGVAGAGGVLRSAALGCSVAVAPGDDPSSPASVLQVRVAGASGWLGSSSSSTTLRGASLLQASAPPLPLDLSRDGTLRITLPPNSLDTGASFWRVAAVPILAAPQVLITRSPPDSLQAGTTAPTLSFRVSDVRTTVAPFYIVLSGLRWSEDPSRADAARRAFGASAGASGGPGGFAARSGVLLASTTRLSAAALQVTVGPDPSYSPAGTEAVRLNVSALFLSGAVEAVPGSNASLDALTTDVVGGSLTFILDAAAARQGAGSCGGDRRQQYKSASVVLSVLAVLLSVASSGIAGGVHSAVLPGIAAGVVHMWDPSACNQALGGIAAGCEWVLVPRAVVSSTAAGHDSAINLAVAAGALILYAAAAKVSGVLRHTESPLYGAWFPSVPAAPALLLLHGAVFAAAAPQLTSAASVALVCCAAVALGAFAACAIEGLVTYCRQVAGLPPKEADLLPPGATDLPRIRGAVPSSAFTRLQHRLVPRPHGGDVADSLQLQLNFLHASQGVLQAGVWSGTTVRGLGILFQWAAPGDTGALRLRCAYAELGVLVGVLPLFAGMGRSGDTRNVSLVLSAAAVLLHAMATAALTGLRLSRVYRAAVVAEAALLALLICVLLHFSASSPYSETSTWHGDATAALYCSVLVVHCAACVLLLWEKYHTRSRAPPVHGSAAGRGADAGQDYPMCELSTLHDAPSTPVGGNPLDTAFAQPQVVAPEGAGPPPHALQAPAVPGQCPGCSSGVAAGAKFCYACGFAL